MEKKCSVHRESVQAPVVTVDHVLNFIGLGRFQLLVFLLGSMGYVSFGLEDVTFTFINTPIRDRWNMSDLRFSALPAMTSVSNLVGAVVFGSLTDLYGRVWPFGLCIAMVGVFTLASAFAGSWPVFFALRLTVSVATGGIPTFIFPSLIEFLPTKNRGQVASLVKVIQMCGSCIATGVAWWLIPSYPDKGWRYFVIAIAIPSLFTATLRLAFWIESPRFLINRGEVDRAWKVLNIVAWVNGKDLSSFTSKEELQLSVKQSHPTCAKQTLKGTLYDLFWKYANLFRRPYFRTTVTLILINICTESGDYGSTLFLPNILKPLVPERYLYFLPLVALFARIPGLLFMSIIIEWPEVGRIRSLKLFAFFTAIFLLLSGLVRTPVATSVFLILVYFNMEPLTPIQNTYISEFYPTEVRSVALVVMGIFSNIAMIGTPFGNGYIADVAPKLPWLFGVVMSVVYFVTFALCFLLNKETREVFLTDNVPQS